MRGHVQDIDDATVDEMTISVPAIGRGGLHGYGVALRDPYTQSGCVYWWPSRREYLRAVQLAKEATCDGLPRTCLDFCSACFLYPTADEAIQSLLGSGDNNHAR